MTSLETAHTTWGVDHEGARANRDVLLFSAVPGSSPEDRLLSSIADLNSSPEPIGSLNTLPDALDRACLAAKVAAENKGQNVVVLDLREVTPIFDYFVISTGASRRQVHTIVEETDAALRAVGDRRLGIEGYETSRWIVQDYGDVVVHTFDHDTREFYQLEELWADAKRIDWEDELD
jgi:ribosome-associated protein